MILGIFTYWQVIVACLVVMFALPLIFFLASFDKRPTKIKRRALSKAAEKPEDKRAT